MYALLTDPFRAEDQDWQYTKRRRLRPKAFEAIRSPMLIDTLAIDYFYYASKHRVGQHGYKNQITNRRFF